MILRVKPEGMLFRNPVSTLRDPASGRAPHFVGQRAVGERLGEMHPADLVGAIEIGERARDPQHAMIAARRQPHGVGGIPQQRKPTASGRATSSSRGAGAAALVRTCGSPIAA